MVHRLLKLFLALAWIYIRDTHRITHTQRVGIFFPFSHITTHAGNIARDMVGTSTQLLLASIQLGEEPTIQVLYGIILRIGNT